MNGFVKTSLYRGKAKLTTPVQDTLTTIDQYYKINGTWSDGNSLGFSVSPTGVLTYFGCNKCCFLFSGVSDVQADKVCQITYSLYINGVLVSGAETPASFEHANSIKSISITDIIDLYKGDEIEVYAKSDTATTKITPSTLVITFLGTK